MTYIKTFWFVKHSGNTGQNLETTNKISVYGMLQVMGAVNPEKCQTSASESLIALFLSISQTILKQLVDAAIELQDNCIFHRDIKSENILIETSSNVPRVRLIDFGLSCFDKKRSFYHIFYGKTTGFYYDLPIVDLYI